MYIYYYTYYYTYIHHMHTPHIHHIHHILSRLYTYIIHSLTYRVSDGVEVAPDLVLAPVSWVDIHCGQSPVYSIV